MLQICRNLCCVRSEGSVLCQGCEAENLVSEDSTLSKGTVCICSNKNKLNLTKQC